LVGRRHQRDDHAQVVQTVGVRRQQRRLHVHERRRSRAHDRRVDLAQLDQRSAGQPRESDVSRAARSSPSPATAATSDTAVHARRATRPQPINTSPHQPPINPLTSGLRPGGVQANGLLHPLTSGLRPALHPLTSGLRPAHFGCTARARGSPLRPSRPAPATTYPNHPTILAICTVKCKASASFSPDTRTRPPQR
jgi:hypothetical protein